MQHLIKPGMTSFIEHDSFQMSNKTILYSYHPSAMSINTEVFSLYGWLAMNYG